MKVAQEFRDAEALADFANLSRQDSKAIDYFRHNYPDFAPSEWWGYKFKFEELLPVVVPYGNDPINPVEYGAVIDEGLAPMWHEAQSQVWVAWENEFKFPNVFGLTALLRSVFLAPAEMVLHSLNLYLPDGDLCELSAPKLYQFHRAVLYLHQNPWQAAICKDETCGKYFVRNHGKREFCEYPNDLGVTCRKKNDHRRKLLYYYETGKEKRQEQAKRASARSRPTKKVSSKQQRKAHERREMKNR